MRLYIGNKNLSSWSMRAWLVCTAFDLPFEEIVVPFSQAPDCSFQQTMQRIHPNGKVPALQDGDVLVWDSLAICEYLAERFPEKALYPKDAQQRVRARCISAEMHSSFMQLRQLCGMNIKADLREAGAGLWAEHEGLRKEMQRIEQIWAGRPQSDGFYAAIFQLQMPFMPQ